VASCSNRIQQGSRIATAGDRSTGSQPDGHCLTFAIFAAITRGYRGGAKVYLGSNRAAKMLENTAMMPTRSSSHSAQMRRRKRVDRRRESTRRVKELVSRATVQLGDSASPERIKRAAELVAGQGGVLAERRSRERGHGNPERCSACAWVNKDGSAY
jgi:hypothetical protein